MANAIVWNFDTNTFTPTNVLNVGFIQPLLRRAGRDRILEQLTITEHYLMPDGECYFEMSMAEALAEGCAEEKIRPKLTSSKSGTNSYVTGKFEYEDREFDEAGFTGVNPYLPVRMADVEVFDNSTGTVLATTHTNNQGEFNATISLASATDVAARVLTSSEGSQRLFNQSVTKSLGM